MSIVESLQPTSPAGSAHWLRPLTRCWPELLCQLLNDRRSVVRVLLAVVQGSAPRDAGTCMLVTRDANYGTIGGGALEQHAVDMARALLGDTAAIPAHLQKLVLGKELSQCCGGVVQVWIEKFTRADLPLLSGAARCAAGNTATTLTTTLRDGRIQRQLGRAAHTGESPVRVLRTADNAITLQERIGVAPPVWIYGAGHVGQALVRVLADLPLRVTWLDSRAQVLPADVPASIDARHVVHPVDTVCEAPADTRFLVLTHDHALDYDLCRAILQRNDFSWLGLIGSKSKGAKFRSRLAREPVAPDLIARMVCPIGIGVASKWPAAIAIAVAAQLLQTLPQQVGHERTAAESLHADSDCSAERCATCSSHRGAR
jgi:xanthine dehydrogenase accessory factor